MTVDAGDFGVTPVGGVTGRLIRFGQWLNGDGFANYGHAFVVVAPGLGIEARPNGAGLVDLRAYPDAVYFSCPDDKRVAVVGAAQGFKGTPYSFGDYLALAAVRFSIPGGHWLRQYVASDGHMICSQLVDACYQRAGIQLFNDFRLPGDVTPADLYNVIERQQNATHLLP